MPHLVFRGIEVEKLRKVSSSLVEELARVCGCGTDNFMLELVHTTAVQFGKIVPSFPFVEVAWFERGQAVRDLFAETLAKHLNSLGLPEVEIAFVAYREDSYYLNGSKCFDSSGIGD